MEINLKTIGLAKNSEKKHTGGWAGVSTDVIINKEYQDALDGLADYSHCLAIYWLHQESKCVLKHVPQGKEGIVPEVGIFACRCPHRPNPIGVSTVKILKIKGNVLTVQGLDVIDGTPILDIKPYTPQYDAAPDAKVPAWVNKLDY